MGGRRRARRGVSAAGIPVPEPRWLFSVIWRWSARRRTPLAAACASSGAAAMATGAPQGCFPRRTWSQGTGSGLPSPSAPSGSRWAHRGTPPRARSSSSGMAVPTEPLDSGELAGEPGCARQRRSSAVRSPCRGIAFFAGAPGASFVLRVSGRGTCGCQPDCTPCSCVGRGARSRGTGDRNGRGLRAESGAAMARSRHAYPLRCCQRTVWVCGRGGRGWNSGSGRCSVTGWGGFSVPAPTRMAAGTA